MTRIRFAIAALGIQIALHAPVPSPRRSVAHEFVVIDSRIARPHTAGTAKIGNAALGADPRAGECDRASGTAKPTDKLVDGNVHELETRIATKRHKRHKNKAIKWS